MRKKDKKNLKDLNKGSDISLSLLLVGNINIAKLFIFLNLLYLL